MKRFGIEQFQAMESGPEQHQKSSTKLRRAPANPSLGRVKIKPSVLKKKF
jgi:hypothetical protein